MRSSPPSAAHCAPASLCRDLAPRLEANADGLRPPAARRRIPNVSEFRHITVLFIRMVGMDYKKGVSELKRVQESVTVKPGPPHRPAFHVAIITTDR